MEQKILSVSQINQYIQSKMDTDPLLGGVAIRGEISNYKIYPSGHHYFTIKDESAALRCVMFRSNAIRLKFQPESGRKEVFFIAKHFNNFPTRAFAAWIFGDTCHRLDTVFDLVAAVQRNEDFRSVTFFIRGKVACVTVLGEGADNFRVTTL